VSNSDKPIVIYQVRKGTFKGDGTVQYAIITEARVNRLYTGDLRDSEYLLNLFVNTVVDAEDPSLDTFSNYATIADLDLIPTGRDTAVAQGLNKYRTNVNKISFDNLSVAISAAQVVRDTINNLVATYLRVKAEFIGSDSHFLPYNPELSSLRDELISSYKASRDARVVAEQEQEALQQLTDESSKIVAVRSETKQTLCSLSDKLVGLNTLIQTIGNKYVDTVEDIIDTSVANISAINEDADAMATINTLKQYIRDNIVSLGLLFDDSGTSIVSSTGTGLSLLASLNQLAIESATACAAATNSAAVADTALANHLYDLKNRQELKIAASQAEEAALGQLTQYCPNLDPSSI
jgi:hypothetical protein